MTNQERLALADRVQKDLQKKLLRFRIIRRKERIERGLKSEKNTRES